MKHIDQLTILSLLENTLEKDAKKNIRQHMEICNKCYMEYASKKSSYLEINQAELPEVPKELFNEVQNLIVEPVSNPTTSQTNKFIVFINDLLDNISGFFIGITGNSQLGLKQVLVPIVPLLLITFILFRQFGTTTNSVPIGMLAENDSILTKNDILIAEDLQKDSSITMDLANTKIDKKSWQKNTDTDIVFQASKKIDNYEKEIIEIYAVVWEPEITRGGKSEIKYAPDLSGRSYIEIKKYLQSKNIRHIIYKKDYFKQIPEAGIELKSKDTLKVFINK